MKLVAHTSEAAPWLIFDGTDETALGVPLADAFLEAATQTASDAGSELLESGSEEDRDLLRDHMIAMMQLRLRQIGDWYIAPDGVRYTLEEDR